MKIVIDISLLHPAALKRGVGFYSLNLFKALNKLNDNNQYILKKEESKRLNADLIHYPYFDPFFLTLPSNKNKPVVVTVHDLTPLKFPLHYPAGIRGKVKFKIQKNSLKKTQAIITDSNNSKKDIIKIIGYPKDKIFSIPLAAAEEFKRLRITKNKEKLNKRYQLPDNFLLYVGDLNWNKNLKGLVGAFKEIKDKNKNNKSISKLELVFIGEAFGNKNLVELKELKKYVKKLNIDKQVKYLGFVTTKDLVKIYNLCILYIQPSFYEGFGLPVLEAISCGCPVLCSNQASLPEVGDNAVEYFNPHNKNEFVNKLSSLLNNPKKLERLSRLGIEQAKKFSWKKTALQTRDVYKKILRS